MEWMDIYDEERQKTGRVMERADEPAPGDCRTVVHVCVFNAAGQLLIQRRSAKKVTYPLRWDVTAAGAVDAGETPRQAAERELREEMGIAVDLSRVRPVMTVNFPNGFDDMFAVERELDPKELTLQTEEVCEAKWVTLAEAERMVRTKEFCPYPPGLLTVVYSLRRGEGFADN